MARPWNSCESRAKETANMMAPPIPCAPRAKFRNSGLVAAPHAAEAAVNSAITPEYGLSNRCRGPKMLKKRSRTVSMP